MKQTVSLNWRVAWYSVLIWVLAFTVGGLVVMPWFFLTLPLVVLWVTIFYFRRTEIVKMLAVKRGLAGRDKILALGLGVSLVWFLILSVLSVFELAGFYYFDFGFYFSDARNWFLFPLVLLMPVVYSLVLENKLNSRRRRRKLPHQGIILTSPIKYARP